MGPVGHYPYFVKMVNDQRISLKDCWFINMDEYLDDNDEWIDADNPLSFRGFMARNVYDKIDPELVMPEEQRVFPDPARPGQRGPRDRQPGRRRHRLRRHRHHGATSPFNEPQPELTCEEFAALETRALDIHPETRATNSVGDLGGALEDMPHRCVTIGMREILGARKVRLGVFRDWHRGVVRRAAYGEPTARLPRHAPCRATPTPRST